MNRSFNRNHDNSFGYNSELYDQEYNSNSQSQSMATPPKERYIPLDSYKNYNSRRSSGSSGNWRNSTSYNHFSNSSRQSFHRNSPMSNSPYGGNKYNQNNRKFSSPTNSYSPKNTNETNSQPHDITQYFDPKNILEDPWEPLLKVAKTEQLNTSFESNKTSQDSISSHTLVTDSSSSSELVNNSSISV